MMKKGLFKLMMMVFTLGVMHQLSAQVSGLSYTLAPTAEYAWNNGESGLADGFLAGGQIGFGFGQNVELAAIYLQGVNMETAQDRFDIDLPNYLATDVDYRKYGGEIKLNLSRTALKPYISIGTGVQEMGISDKDQYKQIYTTGGIGIKLTAADRYTLAIQGNTNYYNLNATRTFLDPDYIEENGIDVDALENEFLNNYSLRAALVFYIGGRDPDALSEIDEAYWENFSSGFRGLSVPIEPSVMKVEFHDDLNFRDAYFAGGSVGFNFGPLVGIRGFYFQALEEDEYTKFDPIAMYGGEAKFKLNEGKGFVPSILLGGGNIDAYDDYVGREDDGSVVEDKAFASGGLGLDLPFSKYFKASGYVKALVTSGASEVENIVQPDDIQTSLAYGASLNFILGKEADKPNVVRKAKMDKYMSAQEDDYDESLEELKDKYSDKIDELNKKLDKALDNNDSREINRLSKEVESAEKVRDRLDRDSKERKFRKRDKNNDKYRDADYRRRYRDDVNMRDAESLIKMSPSEFQLIIRDLLDARENELRMNNDARRFNNNDQSSIETLKKEMKSDRAMENVISGMESMQATISEMNDKMADLQKENNQLRRDADEKAVMAKREKEIEMLKQEIANNREKMAEMKANQGANINNIQDKTTRDAVATYTRAMEKQLEVANRRIMELSNQISNLETKKEKKVVVSYDRDGNPVTIIDNDSYTVSNADKVNTREYDETESGIFNSLRYQGMSGFAGFSVGGSATFNLGYRLHYNLKNNKNVEFMPETFFGLGSPSSFGLSANVLYKMPIIKSMPKVVPYVGAGLGLLKVGDDDDEDKIKGGVNLILGTSLNVWNGDVYVDFTTRNFFDYNQIVVGYRFPF